MAARQQVSIQAQIHSFSPLSAGDAFCPTCASAPACVRWKGVLDEGEDCHVAPPSAELLAMTLRGHDPFCHPSTTLSMTSIEEVGQSALAVDGTKCQAGPAEGGILQLARLVLNRPLDLQLCSIRRCREGKPTLKGRARVSALVLFERVARLRPARRRDSSARNARLEKDVPYQMKNDVGPEAGPTYVEPMEGLPVGKSVFSLSYPRRRVSSVWIPDQVGNDRIGTRREKN